MKKIWFLGLLLVAHLSYAQVSIQKHFFHCTQKDSATLYLWQDFILQQTLEFPDTFYCDEKYFLPNDGTEKSKTFIRHYSKVMDSMSIQGVPYKNGKMLRAVLSVVQGHVFHVTYGRTRSLVNYGVVWGITTTDYICDYNRWAKTVHFSKKEVTVYPWKRATLICAFIFLALIGAGWIMRGNNNPDYAFYAVWICCANIFFVGMSDWLSGIPSVGALISVICLSLVAYLVLRASHLFFAKRESRK